MTLGGARRRVHAAHGHAVVPLDAADTPGDLGGKGHALAAMAGLGLPVPPAFCLTSEWCAECAQNPAAVVDRVWDDVLGGLSRLEVATGRSFGRGPNPLVVAVRSSGTTSMPGMLETVLDVGIDDVVQAALAAAYSPEFAQDTRERLSRGYRRAVSADVPRDPHEQLRGAIEAVLSSWSSRRTEAYRGHHGLAPQDTVAVVVQAMVFGNLDARSGTGVLFSRNPTTGDSEPFGEWLPAGQGEDVVSGTVKGEPISALRRQLPEVYDELIAAARRLERQHEDVQDVEFTVEGGTLWLLQSRAAQCSPRAALRLALALHDEGVLDDAELLGRVSPAQLAATTSGSEDLHAAPLLATGEPACPGVVSGLVCSTSDDAIDAAESGHDVILVRPTTSPDDVAGMLAARGVVTEAGGASSHAAIVARELGRPAVVGCGIGVSAELDGRVVTVDGDRGEVRDGAFEPSTRSVHDDADVDRFAAVATRAARR